MNPVDSVLAVALRSWRKTLRRPGLLTLSLLQPLMWMLFFGFLFERYSVAGLAPGLTYIDFLAPGVCAMTVLFGASQSGIAWIHDLQCGVLPTMLRTPTSHHVILIGKLLADVLRLLLQALLVLALAGLLGATFNPPNSGLFFALVQLALFATLFSCLSCAVALYTRRQEAMALLVHAVNMPILFTSTALVPQRQMPGWLAQVSDWNPLSLTVDGWRGAVLFGESPAAWSVVCLALLAVCLYTLAARQMQGVGKMV